MANSFIDSLYGELEGIEGSNGQNYQTGAGAKGITFLNDYTNRLFGAPFQLLNSVDERFEDINANLGNEYLRNFILNSPILRIRPGMPKYTGDKNETSLSNLVKTFYKNTTKGGMSTGKAFEYAAASIVFKSGKKLQGRMFGFRETYYDYIQHVNYMCRSLATYMNLMDNTEFPNGCYVGKNGSNVFKTFDAIDWQDYRMSSQGGNSTPTEQLKGVLDVLSGNIKGAIGSAASFIDAIIPGDLINDDWIASMKSAGEASSLIGQIESKISSVDFMVEPIQFNESLNNQTKNSVIEGAIDGIKDSVGNELAWITNSNADVGIIDDFIGFLGDGMESVSQSIGGLVQSTFGGFTNSLFSGAIGALRGQKMIYPKIYDRSDSRMDYEFSMTLTTPYGDPYNYYMNIAVPLIHLIALTAPRMVTSNTVSSPFLVQAYIPGMCTCQLGIISDLNITKNPNSNHVSVNGFPLTVTVKFTIEELYNAMAISPANDPASFMFNETLNDYLCNMAGLAPSQDTYQAQRSSKYQGIERYFDQGLFAQDMFHNVSGKIENAFI